MTTQEPTITLNPLKNTVVRTQTPEEHNTLLRVYESGGWTWLVGDLPTSRNHFNTFRDRTYLTTEDGFLYGSIDAPWILEGRKRIICPEEFYRTQRLTSSDIKNIDCFFDELQDPNGMERNKREYHRRQTAEWDAEVHP